MSLFVFKCLKCKKGKYFMGEPSSLKEFICNKCNSKHIQIGRIWGLHICHSHPIWQLGGTEKINIADMVACVQCSNQKIKVEWIIKDEDKIKEYEERLGLTKRRL